MKTRNRDDYFNYTKEGEILILEMQCESCTNKVEDPEVCKEYPEGKPAFVFTCSKECPKYIRK